MRLAPHLVIPVLVGLVCASATACATQPKKPSAPSVDQAASTMVALTFEAATNSAPAASTAPALPEFLLATPTFQAPVLFVNSDAKCRTGPAASSKVVASFTAGTVLEMVGRSTAAGGWLVKAPNSDMTCWIQVMDSSPSGSFQSLPELTPEPSTHEPPAAPVQLSWPFYCSYVDGVLYKITIHLSWVDSANDANGFRIYRQDQIIGDVPPDVFEFSDSANVVLGSSLSYSVEAYNDAGASPRLVKTFPSVCK